MVDQGNLQSGPVEHPDRVEAYVSEDNGVRPEASAALTAPDTVRLGSLHQQSYAESVAWVVRITLGKDRQVMYVRARTEGGAIDTARWHSTMPRKADAYAHKAHPKELGCVEVKA